MGGLSIWHLLILIIIELLWVVPLWKLFGRVGFNAAWSLLALVPIIGVVLLWVLAFARWRIADAYEEPMTGFRS